MIETIKELIGMGFTEKAIDLLLATAPLEYQNDILLLKNRKASVNREEKLGRLSFRDSENLTSQILTGVLFLCDEIDQALKAEEAKKEREVKEIQQVEHSEDKNTSASDITYSNDSTEEIILSANFLTLYFYAINSMATKEEEHLEFLSSHKPDSYNYQRWKGCIDAIPLFIKELGIPMLSPNAEAFSNEERSVDEKLSIKIADKAWQRPNKPASALTIEEKARIKAPKIFILLTNAKDFATKRGVPDAEKSLTQVVHFFRNTCLAIEGKEELSEYSIDYQPIITIGVEDIMDMFSDEEDEQDFRRDLHLDHRIKYLDSSVWNRYIPLYTAQDDRPFSTRFICILQKMLAWHVNGVYKSIAAITTLEFQTRMLLNSFIAKVGHRGHNELVRPFKFHSETQMFYKTKSVTAFFEKKHEGDLSLKESLSWNLLLVDDQAEKNTMSTLDEKEYPHLKKAPLIRELLQQDILHFNIDPPDDDFEIVDKMIHKMNKTNEKSYDLILLDYLLGTGKFREREYGHGFLLKLRENAELQRGPFNKHWILPISSFPHAFSDKLNQLGINHLTDWWHLSNGGDPICAPELFRYNILEFLKQQINVCFYDVESLIKTIQKFIYFDDFYEWIESVERSILHIQAYRDQLRRKTKSAFCLSLYTFIKGQTRLLELEQELLELVKRLKSLENNQKLWQQIDQFKISHPEFTPAFPVNFNNMLAKRRNFNIYLLSSFTELDEPSFDLILTTIKSIRDPHINYWYTELTDAGDPLLDKMREKINDADLFLILFSRDLIASDEKYEELKVILRTDKKVIPILCRPSIMDEYLSSLKPIPADGIPLNQQKDKDRIMDEVDLAIRHEISKR